MLYFIYIKTYLYNNASKGKNTNKYFLDSQMIIFWTKKEVTKISDQTVCLDTCFRSLVIQEKINKINP